MSGKRTLTQERAQEMAKKSVVVRQAKKRAREQAKPQN